MVFADSGEGGIMSSYPMNFFDETYILLALDYHNKMLSNEPPSFSIIVIVGFGIFIGIRITQ